MYSPYRNQWFNHQGELPSWAAFRFPVGRKQHVHRTTDLCHVLEYYLEENLVRRGFSKDLVQFPKGEAGPGRSSQQLLTCMRKAPGRASEKLKLKECRTCSQKYLKRHIPIHSLQTKDININKLRGRLKTYF